VLGELPLFGLPAILIPYPFAWRYQKVNADYLVRHGAAIMVKNEELSEKLLSTTLKLVNDSDKLSEMSKQMELLHQPQAAQKIAELLIELTEKRVRGRIR
jgi:UDP-N-acetylglucosamine--N-acetylmuramyl-(pentapeptide) pyrophosphoryl-undecaprenol N-acetylglucosamine transferase